ncbi:MAG: MmcQ/YjbR family DNA-binding protein [Bacteroidota bacterium]
MNIEEFREYCMNKSGVTEELPFGESTLVFKVLGKIFALTSLDSEVFSVNLKCEPEKAIQLRETYASVKPGYHMNKQHWNTVYVNGSISRSELCEWINDSYSLVVAKLTKAQQQSLANVPL